MEREEGYMRFLTGVFSFFVLGTGFHRSIEACTIFKITRSGTTLVGNNEDDNNPDTKIWVLAPETGKHGRIFFGYNDAIPQGGMNDQGLFFDWVADNPSSDWVHDPRKLNYPGSVSEKILEEAATVDEALRFYDRYNETAFLKSRTLLVDKTGASAIVNWQKGKVQITRGQGEIQAMGFGYDTALARLKKLEEISIPAVAAIVEACLQFGDYPTQYSNVYDLSRGDVYVYLFRQQKPFVKLNLQEELRKGHHCYNIPLLAAQLRQPPMTDSKTQRVAVIDPAVCVAYVGKYQIPPDYVLTVTTADGKLYIEAPDVSRTEVYPASPTKFFIRSLDSYVLFKPDALGRIGELHLHVQGRDSVGRRIQ